MEKIPFDPKEIENAEELPGMYGMVSKVYDTPISPKENMQLIYDRKIPLWLPTANDRRTMTPRIDPDNMARAFSFEATPMPPADQLTGGPDKFGIPWVYVAQVGGSMVEPGDPTLKDANDWQDVINFPDVANWDWAGSAETNKDWVNTDKWLIYSHLTGFFERLISFMDFENAAVALVDDDQKDAVHSLFDALADCYIDIFTRAYNAYGYDCLNLHDDWGSQRAPFFSLDVAMEMIAPHIKKVADFVHNELNIPFDIHSCGKNELLVPAYIAAGADSWSGQPMNDKPWIYNQYGDKIILGMDIVLPEGKVAADLSTEEAIAIGQKFLDTYIPNYANKPITGGSLMVNGFADFMYEASRKAFYNLA